MSGERRGGGGGGGGGDEAGERDALLARHAALPPDPEAAEHGLRGRPRGGLEAQWRKNLVLLLGVFLVNSDSAVLLALFRKIGSEFGEMGSAGWIVNSSTIGLIVTQPLYGKLSDIYGRKPLLVVAYLCCCLGGLLGGLGFSFWGVLLGRALAGVGTAGIAVLVSTLIVDLVPIRDVAVWRSYVYSVNQIGRAVGPPLGGLIADKINWRWSLLYPVPLNVLGLIFVWRRMTFPSPAPCAASHGLGPRSRFARIDMLGSVSLGLANLSLLLFLDQLQRHPDATRALHGALAVVPLSSWAGFLALFVAAEAFWAREPVLPLRLLARRNVFSAYSIQFLQTAAQTAVRAPFSPSPSLDRATSWADLEGATAALHVDPALLPRHGRGLEPHGGGPALGRDARHRGRRAGQRLRHQAASGARPPSRQTTRQTTRLTGSSTGQFRIVTIVSVFVSNASFLAIFLRWRGAAGWPETLYGFPIGVGFGVSLSAAFIGLTSSVEASAAAVSTSGFYLSLNLGSLIGVSSASLLISSFVKRTLRRRLRGVPGADAMIGDVTSDLETIQHLPGWIREAVLETYTQSFVHVWFFCLLCGCMAWLASLLLHQGQRNRPKDQAQHDG